MNRIKFYISSFFLRLKKRFKKKGKVKYEYDRNIIKIMKERYGMESSFSDDGLYFFDLKSSPRFTSAKLNKTKYE